MESLLYKQDSVDVENLIRSLSISLGNIGTPEAFERLDNAKAESNESLGLSFAIDRISDPVQFRRTATKLLASKTPLRYLVIHAIGRHGADEFKAELQLSLESSNPFERGVSALALTRLSNPPSKSTLLEIMKQSAYPHERLFTTLAILRIDPTEYPTLEDQLRTDLGDIGIGLRSWPTLEGRYS
jgi:hypothetical protein